MPARMKLSSVYSTLPQAEKKVADFILANPEEAAHMVINEIAHHAGVSVPSVTRLARKLGYNGFMDFRVSLASGMSSINKESVSPITKGDSDEEAFKKLMIGQMTSIESTLKVVDMDKLVDLTNKVFDFRRVVWFSVGSCSQLARNVSCGLCRLGIDSIVMNDRDIMETYSEAMREGDLVFALTRTGRTQHTLNCLRKAKANGASTVLVTNLLNSQGEQWADYFFCTSRHDDLYRICGYETGTAMCALLESFMILVGRKKRLSSNMDFSGSMEFEADRK